MVTERELRSICRKTTRRFLERIKARDFETVQDGIKFIFLDGLLCYVTHPPEELYTVLIMGNEWAEEEAGVCKEDITNVMVILMKKGWMEN